MRIGRVLDYAAAVTGCSIISNQTISDQSIGDRGVGILNCNSATMLAISTILFNNAILDNTAPEIHQYTPGTATATSIYISLNQ